MNSNRKDLKMNDAEIRLRVDMWKFFSARADTLKDELHKMTIWIFGMAGGITALIFNKFIVQVEGPASLLKGLRTAPFAALALSGIGCLLCTHCLFLILDYGTHIKRNWKRAEKAMENVTLIREILVETRNGSSRGLSGFFGKSKGVGWHLNVVAMLFLAGFATILVVSLIALTS